MHACMHAHLLPEELRLDQVPDGDVREHGEGKGEGGGGGLDLYHTWRMGSAVHRTEGARCGSARCAALGWTVTSSTQMGSGRQQATRGPRFGMKVRMKVAMARKSASGKPSSESVRKVNDARLRQTRDLRMMYLETESSIRLRREERRAAGSSNRKTRKMSTSTKSLMSPIDAFSSGATVPARHDWTGDLVSGERAGCWSGRPRVQSVGTHRRSRERAGRRQIG